MISATSPGSKQRLTRTTGKQRQINAAKPGLSLQGLLAGRLSP
jgi:hypothetical protein